MINLKTHSQLGDHMICFGFVKELSKLYDKIVLITKPGKFHVENIKRLYSPIKNVVVSHIPPFGQTLSIECDQQWYRDIKTIENEELIFDRHFYKLANVPFEKKWENFEFHRNMETEKDIFYNKLGLKDGEDFIFLHEDPSRKFNIKREHIRNTRMIYPSNHQDISALDFLYVIEKASEVHVINSVFLNFIDLVGLNHSNLYYHKYTRDAWSEQPGLRLNWNIID